MLRSLLGTRKFSLFSLMTIVSEVLDMTHSIWNYVSKRVLPSRTAEIDNELRYSTLVTLKFMAREGSLTSIEFSLAATGAVLCQASPLLQLTGI